MKKQNEHSLRLPKDLPELREGADLIGLELRLLLLPNPPLPTGRLVFRLPKLLCDDVGELNDDRLGAVERPALLLCGTVYDDVVGL